MQVSRHAGRWQCVSGPYNRWRQHHLARRVRCSTNAFRTQRGLPVYLRQNGTRNQRARRERDRVASRVLQRGLADPCGVQLFHWHHVCPTASRTASTTTASSVQPWQ